ncbi:MAG: DUF3375 domain-containing protein [Synergistaceae bacterium]|nr:DUF3375 domain-containing protein [Synergistaceae bacterium]
MAFNVDYEYLLSLRRNNPAWRLLCADSAPLILSFLNRVFIEANEREISEPDLVEKLEDELYSLRDIHGSDAFPRAAADYLYDWAEPDKGWLRRFYASGDEPYFDLTPSSEKAISWVKSLAQGTFVGTESRLKIIFELLRQITEGSEEDPALQIKALEKRRDEISDEIERIKNGRLRLLDDTAVRDRFLQFSSMARELLSDFREVEYNFRALDRDVRRRIALSTAGKGEILDDVLGRSDSIEESDQGRSFRAFTEYLLSPSRQEELHELLGKVFQMKAVLETNYDGRLARISDSWLAASDHTLVTMRLLSAQLRQFLDGRVWLENRRITELLQNISRNALTLESLPEGDFMELDEPGVEINLIMERPLFVPSVKSRIESGGVALAEDDAETDSLFEQFYVDSERLIENIRGSLAGRPQATLGEVTAKFPVTQGLAELVTYMSIAANSDSAFFDEGATEYISWRSEDGALKRAELPRIIFTRSLNAGGAIS